MRFFWPCQSRVATFTIAFLALCSVVRAHASIGLVVGEPFGSFGTMMPVGHAGIYLDHLCAASPTRIRRCLPGEPPGVVVSRYHDLTRSHLDWLATPAFVFFYGVATPADVPDFITPALRDSIRMTYRDAHLRSVVPGPVSTRFERDGALHFKDGEDWQESIGATFDRRVFLYTFSTTPTQDDALLNYLNDLPNRRRYTLAHSNCADFAVDVLRVFLPQQDPPILRRAKLTDFNVTSPKSLARQIDAFGHQHPELNFAVYELPQLPGSTRRSRPVRSGAEALLTTRRYLITLSILQPEFVLEDTIAYETKGRWKPGLDAVPLTPFDWPAPAAQIVTEIGLSVPEPLALQTAGEPQAYKVVESSRSTSSRIASDAIGLRAK